MFSYIKNVVNWGKRRQSLPLWLSLPLLSLSPPASPAPSNESAAPGRWALGPIAWLEHYLPDAFVFALIATGLVFGAGLF